MGDERLSYEVLEAKFLACKGRKDTGELTAAEAGIYLKCLAILGAKEAVMSMNQMESLSDKMSVVELPFEVRG